MLKGYNVDKARLSGPSSYDEWPVCLREWKQLIAAPVARSGERSTTTEISEAHKTREEREQTLRTWNSPPAHGMHERERGEVWGGEREWFSGYNNAFLTTTVNVVSLLMVLGCISLSLSFFFVVHVFFRTVFMFPVAHRFCSDGKFCFWLASRPVFCRSWLTVLTVKRCMDVYWRVLSAETNV